MGLTPLVVAIDELRAIVASAQARKAELIALPQIALKGRSRSGVILVVCFMIR